MYYLGVDLGGTNIAAGVVDDTGRILHKNSVPTGVGRPVEEILSDMASVCAQVVKETGVSMDDIAGVGVGSPGLCDDDAGEIVFANNLYWHNVAIREILGGKLGKPVHVENDANVAALAECVCGGMKGAQNAVLLTLGTGVGGGIIMDGKVFGGTHHVGAELGHTLLVMNGEPCTCGNAGCLERYTSATALIREGRKAAQRDPNCAIARVCEGDLERISAKTVIDCARAQDPAALKIYADYIHALTMGIISIINFIDPQSIALGGGVAAAGDFLLEPLRASVANHIFYKTAPWAEIVLASLGNDAGIIGAAMFARDCEA